MKSLFWIPFLLLSCQPSLIEAKEIIIHYFADKEIQKTESCIITILNDSSQVFETEFFNYNSLGSTQTVRMKVKETGNYTIKFESLDHQNNLKEENQIFEINKDTKRIEVFLIFDINESDAEYLESLTVKRILEPPKTIKFKNVGKKEVGFQPVYRIINHGIKEYYGQSAIQYFFGSISKKDNDEWIYLTAGSYCRSTVPEKVLTPNDSVYSSIPSYSYGDEYKFDSPGEYKYSVLIGMQKYRLGTPIEIIENAKTLKEILDLIELEDTFFVK